MTEELKPCPFCGGSDIRQEYGAGSKPPYNEPYVVCVDCGASVEGKSGAWNNRAPVALTAALAQERAAHDATVDCLQGAVELAECYLNIMPDRRGHNRATVDDLRAQVAAHAKLRKDGR